MKIVKLKAARYPRPIAMLLTLLLMLPLFAGCGGGNKSNAPPVDETASGYNNNPSQVKQGLSNKQKVLITLAGAAALYYLYNHHKNKQGQGPNGQYYLSRNGRVYYRDAQHRAHYVTPPPGGIQVPASQAEQYRGFQGYDGRSTGRTLEGLGTAPVPGQ